MCKSLGQQTFRGEAKIVVSSSLQSECSLSFSVLLFLDAIHSFTLSHLFIHQNVLDSHSGSGWALGMPITDLAEISVHKCSL